MRFADDVIEGRLFGTKRGFAPLPGGAALGVMFDPKAMARCHARSWASSHTPRPEPGIWGKFLSRSEGLGP